MAGTDIGIDLGTASILVYINGKGVVLKEPSVVAFDRDTNKIRAIGEEARLMLGRTPGNIIAVRPLRQGVISDYTVTEKMLRYFIQKATGKKTFRKPRIAVCVPSGVTEVEKKAVEDATYQAGAREVLIIEEPIAAAIGAGIDISRPCGNMIVDIGGGTSDIAVISLGGTVVSTSVKVAGDDFDEAIVRYMRKITDEAERYLLSTRKLQTPRDETDTSRFLAFTACLLAKSTNACAIVAHSVTGGSARLLAEAGCGRIQIWPELGEEEAALAYESFGCVCERFVFGSFPVLATRAALPEGDYIAAETESSLRYWQATADAVSGCVLLYPKAAVSAKRVAGCGSFYAENEFSEKFLVSFPSMS